MSVPVSADYWVDDAIEGSGDSSPDGQYLLTIKLVLIRSVPQTYYCVDDTLEKSTILAPVGSNLLTIKLVLIISAKSPTTGYDP